MPRSTVTARRCSTSPTMRWPISAWPSVFEKLNQPDDAIEHYEEYLKVLPNGPLSEEAKKALEKLKASPAQGKIRAKQ